MSEQVVIPEFVWSALSLASGTISLLVHPEFGVLTKLHEQGVSNTYEAVCAIEQVLRETIEGGAAGEPWDPTRAEALVDFIDASMAVWREIDRLELRAEGYRPTDLGIELRNRERVAWRRLRDLIDQDTRGVTHGSDGG